MATIDIQTIEEYFLLYKLVYLFLHWKEKKKFFYDFVLIVCLIVYTLDN